MVEVDRREVAALGWSFAYFSFLLAGYYVLRPVRDEMGVQSGVTTLPHLFAAILLTMLVMVPLFGWLVARFPRRVLLPLLYLFFIADLLCFWGAFQFEEARAWVARAWVARAFFF